MKISMYLKYTSRSLLRGGQRTVLAFFCVGVGVMAIVALQLVGLMLNSAMTANVRAANGGDIALTAGQGSRNFTRTDLNYLDQLKRAGTITGYTALTGLSGSFDATTRIDNSVRVLVVDPAAYPLVYPPAFVQPGKGSLLSLLTGDGAIIDQKLADTYHKRVGSSLTLHLVAGQHTTRVLSARVRGIVTDSGALAQSSRLVLVARSYYQSQFSRETPVFTTVYMTTKGDAQTKIAARRVSERYPLATVQTAEQAMESTQKLSDNIKKFLEIAGLLALLIGGVGIVNTMQVLLSRRKIEIAMLKTSGYRRLDLFFLFGLEAGLLGLSGGILGSLAAIGVSSVVRRTVEQALNLNIPFLLNWPIIGGGVLIGLSTALIFGLMPIAQSANIRPLNVIRELPESHRASRITLTLGLLLLLSVLFCGMSMVILNDVGLALESVYGTLAFLCLLGSFFLLVSFLIGLLPVPERFDRRFLALVSSGVVLSTLLTLALPVWGFLLLVVSIAGFYIVLLPRTWKVSMRMALRNIGRQRARTTTTLIALFVGIFTIGLIVVLGQNMRDLVNTSLANVLTYNVMTSVNGSAANTLQANIHRLPGLKRYERSYVTEAIPMQINHRTIEQILRGVPENPDEITLGRNGVLGIMSSLSGFDVAHSPAPASQLNVTIVSGRDLSARDVNTRNVIVPWVLSSQEPLKSLHFGVGSTVALIDSSGQHSVTLNVVGLYKATGVSMGGQGMYTTLSSVSLLSPGGILQSNFAFKIDPSQVDPALKRIAQLAPSAQSFNLANIGDYINEYLNNILLVLIIIAGLSLLAGVVIIANAVALAMLERRRELGILKSVGYTSTTVLSGVLIENAIIGSLGAFLAMLLVSLITSLLGHFAFNTSFTVNGLVILGLIIGSGLLSALVALLVAWKSVRVRPLAVLRYE